MSTEKGAVLTNPLSANIGDRIQLRQRLWRIQNRHSLSPEMAVLELESLESEGPGCLSVVVPPDYLLKGSVRMKS